MALSSHCNQLVKGSLFLFYLPHNVCHSLETEGALHPNQGLTHSACVWRILSAESRKCYVWLTFPFPTLQSPQRQICTFLILINKINMHALARVPLQISFQEKKKKRGKRKICDTLLHKWTLGKYFHWLVFLWTYETSQDVWLKCSGSIWTVQFQIYV